jgi:hypothetical protein
VLEPVSDDGRWLRVPDLEFLFDCNVKSTRPLYDNAKDVTATVQVCMHVSIG